MKRMMIAMMLFVTLVTPHTAQAQTTVRCRYPTQPGFYRVQGSNGSRTVGVCFVYRPRGVLP